MAKENPNGVLGIACAEIHTDNVRLHNNASVASQSRVDGGQYK